MKVLHWSSVTALLCLVLILAAGGCTRHLKEEIFENPQAQINLLIAGDASAYKDVLRSKIIQRYQSKANIRVININKLGRSSPEDFHAVLIMDTCLAWTHFNPTVLAFLEQPAAKDRVVWFMTVDDTDERYQHSSVDAITAASVIENQQRVETQLTQKIDAILSNKPE